MMMTTTTTKTKTTYDGTAKSAFGSGNVEGQSSVEVFLMTLFVLESVGIRCRQNRRASESSEEEEEEESSSSSGGGERGCDVDVVFFFFTAGRTVERFSIRVAPDDRVRVSSEGERCFGRLRVRATDDAESIDVSQSRRRKRRKKKREKTLKERKERTKTTRRGSTYIVR